MTVELAAYAPEDIETALVAHLFPLRTAGLERKPGDKLPFTLLAMITGIELADIGTSRPVVSVSTLCDKALGFPAARDESNNTHRRMLLLNTKPQITVGARLVAVQFVEVVEPPRWEYYSENILRKVGTYRLGLPYVSA